MKSSLLGCTRARPSSVRNLALALRTLGGKMEAEELRELVSPVRQPDSHWQDNLAACEGLGLIERSPNDDSVLLTPADFPDIVEPAGYARFLRRRFQDGENADSFTEHVYAAYRKALVIPLDEKSGGVPDTQVVDAMAVGGPFNNEKAPLWRDWIEAAELGASAGAALVPVPTIALREEICAGNLRGRATIGEFLRTADELGIPLLGPGEGHQLPIGTALALQQLQEDGLIELEMVNDSPEQWQWLSAPRTHIQVRAEGHRA